MGTQKTNVTDSLTGVMIIGSIMTIVYIIPLAIQAASKGFGMMLAIAR